MYPEKCKELVLSLLNGNQSLPLATQKDGQALDDCFVLISIHQQVAILPMDSQRLRSLWFRYQQMREQPNHDLLVKKWKMRIRALHETIIIASLFCLYTKTLKNQIRRTRITGKLVEIQDTAFQPSGEGE